MWCVQLYFLDMNLEAISHSKLIKVAKLKRKEKKEQKKKRIRGCSHVSIMFAKEKGRLGLDGALAQYSDSRTQ